jgi:hypothetical protein
MNEDDLRMLSDDELKSFIPQLIPLKRLRTYLSNNGSLSPTGAAATPSSPSAISSPPSSSFTGTATGATAATGGGSALLVAPDVMTFGECKATLQPVTGKVPLSLSIYLSLHIHSLVYPLYLWYYTFFLFS